MNVQYLNPFLVAAFSVVEMVLGEPPKKGDIALRTTSFTSEQVNVVCGVSGNLIGQIIYGMSLITADRVASKMLGQQIKTFDQLAASAIAELGNMISGNASLQLCEAGFVCDITPPTLVRGTNVEINTLSIPSINIPLTTTLGDFNVTVGLQQCMK